MVSRLLHLEARRGDVFARKNVDEKALHNSNPLTSKILSLCLLHRYSDSMISHMLTVISPVLLSLGSTIAAAAVLPQLSAVNQTGVLHNVTNAADLGAIDPRFTTSYEPGNDALSATSCLMGAVNAMMELALENFTERIRARNYIDLSYPEVVIVPTERVRGQGIEARYLLWGIWEGIRWMISHRSFRQLGIRAYWDGLLVCSISIRRAWGQLSGAGSNGTLGLTARSERISIRNAAVEPTQALSITDVKDPVNDQHLTISVTHVGDVLGITEVFIAIYAALEYMAHFPSTDELIGFRISPDDEDTMIGVIQHTRAPAARLPFLDYQWAVMGVAQIPGYELRQRRFTEVIIEITIDGVPLGEGFLATDKH